MKKRRRISATFAGKPTIEGAGVHLKRAFGHTEAPLFDPFLLLDDFHSDDPDLYEMGFPWHPHRGIETITYVLQGRVDHGDSLGNSGTIGPGDVQWMTAGSGIIHQEMPKGDGKGELWGFQLWANLPSSRKMMDPRYREVRKDQIPVVTLDDGTTVGVVCGRVGGEEGPVRDIVTEPEYLDVTIPPGTGFRHPVKRGHTAIAYVIEGKALFCEEGSPALDRETLLLFEDGDEIEVSTGDEAVRFLLISGRPIGEPVAWYGPIVMNTQEELKVAFEEYRGGTFLKHGAK
jgi:redox-sensitive bicupin YhaK (pirin superfamily)